MKGLGNCGEKGWVEWDGMICKAGGRLSSQIVVIAAVNVP